EGPAMRRHYAVPAVFDRFHDRLGAAAIHGVAVGEVGCAKVLVALAFHAVAGDADAIVQTLALGGEVVVAVGLVLRQRAHVGGHRQHGVVAAHAGEHRAPRRHHALAAVEHGFQHALRAPAP